MDPIENYNHRLLLFCSLAVAHIARCADQAGVLDDNAKRSMAGQIGLLGEAADDLSHDEGLRVHLDMLVRTLPPLPKIEG